MLTLGAVSLALLFLATAARTPPRHAFPKVALCSEDCLRARVARLEKLSAKRLRLAHRFEVQRNHARARVRLLLAQLHPPTPLIAHRAGWLCIHSREGAWTSQTGNGYYGGLQMTYGWMGLVGNAALLSPAQQMTAAETGYRRSGYSHSWLAGQWPNTYPPCAGLF